MANVEQRVNIRGDDVNHSIIVRRLWYVSGVIAVPSPVLQLYGACYRTPYKLDMGRGKVKDDKLEIATASAIDEDGSQQMAQECSQPLQKST